MHKHRGFPVRLTGTDHHFLIRRESKKGATKLERRERYKDRRPSDRKADAAFLEALIDYFGEESFVRGNLDAGRLSWLIHREVKPIGAFDPTDYDQELVLDFEEIARTHPQLVELVDEGEDNDATKTVFFDLEKDNPDLDDDEGWEE